MTFEQNAKIYYAAACPAIAKLFPPGDGSTPGAERLVDVMFLSSLDRRAECTMRERRKGETDQLDQPSGNQKQL